MLGGVAYTPYSTLSAALTHIHPHNPHACTHTQAYLAVARGVGCVEGLSVGHLEAQVGPRVAPVTRGQGSTQRLQCTRRTKQLQFDRNRDALNGCSAHGEQSNCPLIAKSSNTRAHTLGRGTYTNTLTHTLPHTHAHTYTQNACKHANVRTAT
jgi:hypothetical protein